MRWSAAWSGVWWCVLYGVVLCGAMGCCAWRVMHSGACSVVWSGVLRLTMSLAQTSISWHSGKHFHTHFGFEFMRDVPESTGFQRKTRKLDATVSMLQIAKLTIIHVDRKCKQNACPASPDLFAWDMISMSFAIWAETKIIQKVTQRYPQVNQVKKEPHKVISEILLVIFV